jgi:hypothetical protein
MKNLIIIPVFFIFTSCAAQFFVIEDFSGEAIRTIYQNIVISHPPKDQSKLIEIVEEYNRRTISYTEIMKYNFSRNFYRETTALTRKYKKGAPYPNIFWDFWYWWNGQSLGHHPVLLHTYNGRTINGEYWFWITGREDDTKIHFTRVIDNPEEYYLKE